MLGSQRLALREAVRDLPILTLLSFLHAKHIDLQVSLGVRET